MTHIRNAAVRSTDEPFGAVAVLAYLAQEIPDSRRESTHLVRRGRFFACSMFQNLYRWCWPILSECQRNTFSLMSNAIWLLWGYTD